MAFIVMATELGAVLTYRAKYSYDLYSYDLDSYGYRGTVLAYRTKYSHGPYSYGYRARRRIGLRDQIRGHGKLVYDSTGSWVATNVAKLNTAPRQLAAVKRKTP